jgi:hypothetical protein
MRSAGGTRAEKYPQMTVFGVEPNVASGLNPAGAGCPAADDMRPAMPTAAKQIIATPQACFDIGSILSGKMSAQDSIECRPRRKGAARERHCALRRRKCDLPLTTARLARRRAAQRHTILAQIPK